MEIIAFNHQTYDTILVCILAGIRNHEVLG